MKKVLVVAVVVLAAIVPPPAMAGGFDLNKVFAGIQVINAFRGIRASELAKLANQLDEGLISQYGTTNEGLARVQRVVNKLAPGKGYRAQVLASDEKNAMAVPGHVYVTDGLARVLSDDELAGVMAHEVSHIECGHFKDAVKRQRIVAGVGGALQLAGANDSIQNGVGIAAVLGSLAYSRDQEYEADKAGAERAYKDGYAPRGLANALRKLGSKDGVEMLSTHPDTGKRVAKLNALADGWGKVGEVQGPPASKPAPTASTVRPTAQRVAPSAPTFLGGVAVIVRDNASGGGFGWGGYGSSEEAVKTTMESALEKTGRFIVVDRTSREESWAEQDLGDTGRMDPETVPVKGKTHGAKWFLYVTLNYYQMTDEGRVALGNWNSRANIGLVKAEIRGKVKLEPVERSTLAWTGDFRGTEIGKNIEASTSTWRNGIDVSWQSQPAGKAVESACQKTAASLVAFIDSQKGQAVQASIQPLVPSSGKAETFRLHIQAADGGERALVIRVPRSAAIAADYALLMRGNEKVAKVTIDRVEGNEIWGTLESASLRVIDKITSVRLMKSG